MLVGCVLPLLFVGFKVGFVRLLTCLWVLFVDEGVWVLLVVFLFVVCVVGFAL